MNSLQKQIRKTFFQTLEDLKTKGNFETFLKDFLSEEELEVFTNRLVTAYWLKKGRTTKNIKANLKASLTEIKTVKEKLNSKGYKLAIKLMEAEEWANLWSEKIKKLGTSSRN